MDTSPRVADATPRNRTPATVARGVLYELDMADETLFPDVRVCCSACDDELHVGAGIELHEAVWMHEHDCRAAAAALDFRDLG